MKETLSVSPEVKLALVKRKRIWQSYDDIIKDLIRAWDEEQERVSFTEKEKKRKEVFG